VKVGAVTLRKATFAVAGLVVATGVPTLILTFGAGGNGTTPAGTTAHAHRQTAQQPATAAGSSDTSSTTSTTSTTSESPSVSPTTGATTSTAPATTTTPPPPPCQWTQFTVTVTTQASSYSQGQTIPFTVTVANAGPACTDQGQEHCDCWGAYAENSSGQVVWVWGAPGPPTSSISVSSPPPVVPAQWTTSRSMQWDQKECTSSANCPETQAPAGTYRIVGLWADHVTPKPDTSQPVSVTISSSILPPL
jgi:hypothetical protein